MLLIKRGSEVFSTLQVAHSKVCHKNVSETRIRECNRDYQKEEKNEIKGVHSRYSD